MQNKRKTILISFGVLFGMYFLYVVAKMLGPGAYPNAEEYKIEMSKDHLLAAINDFKLNNPNYDVPFTNGSQSERIVNDGPSTSNDKSYNVYFHYPEENKLVFVTLYGGTKSSTVLLVGVNDGLILGNWKRVNEDIFPINYFENKKVIKTFEERIMNKILNYSKK
jgi:hypothetical protein